MQIKTSEKSFLECCFFTSLVDVDRSFIYLVWKGKSVLFKYENVPTFSLVLDSVPVPSPLSTSSPEKQKNYVTHPIPDEITFKRLNFVLFLYLHNQ